MKTEYPVYTREDTEIFIKIIYSTCKKANIEKFESITTQLNP